METEHFDSDLFIDEIQKRPAIWDMESPDYKNKVIKKRNWEELVEIFCDAGDSLEKKKLLGSTLTRKWKSIRDNYIRESKRQKNLPSGSGSSKHVPYVYFAKLKFLESSVVNKDTENNFETPAVTNTDLNNAENEDLIPPSTKIELLNVIQKAQNPALPQQTNQYQYQYAYSTPSYSGYTTARSSTPSQQWSATPPAPAPPPPTSTWVPSPSSQDSDSLHLFE
ncbi:uncharacterized protein LOC111358380 [Spodoptera litura]|uniref:Uncharacterized protein LOC111358380 n=1 Tax=Spodoptera litura TaxID=69820 RepID=A0A9J7EIT3_SPOLT|nr:uncharacterized protein LOC111358380 [Spodoptera litura]